MAGGLGADRRAERRWRRSIDLREVVVEHRADIFRYARSFTRNDADAEDLAQTAVCARSQQGAALAQPRAGQVVRAAHRANLATDQARARARVTVEPWADAPRPRGRPSSCPTTIVAPRRRRRGAPRAAFADLPRGHREVLRLRFLEELDYDEVAERLDVTEHAARQRVYRALQALRAVAQRCKLRPRRAT